ncbi:MAG: histidine phosphatase family protein, partial [Deinococcus sp.]|nr:histidine phosphatase family protein [Deinococcus sp.]
EGMTREEIQKRYPGLWQQRKKDPTMAAPPGGEPLVVMQRRVMASVQEIAQRHLGQTVLVCTHAGPIRAALCGLLGIDLRRSWQFRTDNASLTVVAITEEGAVIEAFNDTRHLSGSYPDSLVP